MTDPERTSSVVVGLPTGQVAVPVLDERPDTPWATLVIAHGAGAGMEHPFLAGFARAMRTEGVRTVRFDFPYRVLGRRMPGPASHAIQTWRDVVQQTCPDERVWLCGKSYGGRMASMAVAEGLDASGLVYLGYPLHAPGKPEQPRVAHLPEVRQPQLFVSGTKDPFVDPREQLEEAVASCQDARLEWIDGARHSFEIAGRRREPDEVGASLAPLVAGFMRDRASTP